MASGTGNIETLGHGHHPVLPATGSIWHCFSRQLNVQQTMANHLAVPKFAQHHSYFVEPNTA